MPDRRNSFDRRMKGGSSVPYPANGAGKGSSDRRSGSHRRNTYGADPRSDRRKQWKPDVYILLGPDAQPGIPDTLFVRQSEQIGAPVIVAYRQGNGRRGPDRRQSVVPRRGEDRGE